MIIYPENLIESTKSSYNWNKEFKKMTKQNNHNNMSLYTSNNR